MSSKPLKDCMCCDTIRLPGELESKPFLQQAENVLLGRIDKKSTLDIEQLLIFPEVIEKIGEQDPRGFEAEYRIHDELKNSKLQMYVFYSPKFQQNEEIGDFLLITKYAVIVLDAKASKLAEDPSELNLENFRRKLMSNKYKKQQDRVISLLESLLKNHDCKFDAFKIYYYNLFANIKRPNSKEKQINLNLDNALFQDDYMQKLCDMTTNRNEIITSDSEYSLRTLLAWFYGTYHKSCSQWSNLEKNLAIEEELNREYELKKGQKSENRDLAGIFLTPVQKVIVESAQPYLHIIGLPGTGKTYCLLMKMVDVYFNILEKCKQNNELINEFILVFHLNPETLLYIKNIFWKTVETLLLKKKMKKEEEVPNKNIIKFISQSFYYRDQAGIDDKRSFRKFIDIDTLETFQTKDYDLSSKFKVFCDDISSDVFNFANVDTKNEMLVAIDRSSFCWCTSYSVISILKNFYRPLAVVKVQNNKIYECSQYVYLRDSLRYTARIHALIDVVLNLSEGTELGHLGLPTFNKSDFSSGTRVLGQKKPMLIMTRNNDDMDKKAYELLKNLIKEEQIKENDVAVIECVRYESESFARKWEKSSNFENYEKFPISFAYESKRQKFSLTETAFNCHFPLRGLEVNHIIICMTYTNVAPTTYFQEAGGFYFDSLYSDGYRKFDLLEALSRAISSVTVFYIEDDPLLCNIQCDLKTAVPSISQSNIYKKKVNLTEVLKSYEPLSMDSINSLNIVKAASEFHYFHFTYHSIRCPVNSSRFLPGVCNLQCIDNLMKELKYNMNSENPEFKNLFFKMVVIGEIVTLLDELLHNLSFYTKFVFLLNEDKKGIFKLRIELTNTNLKKFLQDWKKKLETTTIEQANLLLTEENQTFSYLVRSLVFIIETAALPFIPEIAKCQFSHPESLCDNFSLDKSYSSSSWMYETFDSRRITLTDENGAIIDDVIFEKEDRETQINHTWGQNYQIIRKQLEVLSPFRERILGNILTLIKISRLPIYVLQLPDKADGFSEIVFSPIKKLNQILLGIKFYLSQREIRFSRLVV